MRCMYVNTLWRNSQLPRAGILFDFCRGKCARIRIVVIVCDPISSLHQQRQHTYMMTISFNGHTLANSRSFLKLIESVLGQARRSKSRLVLINESDTYEELNLIAPYI